MEYSCLKKSSAFQGRQLGSPSFESKLVAGVCLGEAYTVERQHHGAHSGILFDMVEMWFPNTGS